VICNPVPSSAEVSITALVDSAADGTMIPIKVLQALGAEYVETRQVRGVSGFAYPVDMYLVKVGIGPHTIYGIQAAAVEHNDEGLIGRDVLNQLVVILNGLAEMVEIEQ
jgi:predicted aspartyl protease